MNIEKLTQSTEDDIILVNIVEELVKAHVSDVIKQAGICACRTCQLNTCAIALNSLPPRYVTSRKGEMFAQVSLMNMSFQTDVIIAVSRALKTVKDCPLH